MKNKVLRLAIVAVLVVAMVLSMAACDPKDPEPTTPTTPTTTTTTTTPPTTTTTTPPTVPSGDDAALAKAAFGYEVTGFEREYAGHVVNDDYKFEKNIIVLSFDKDKMKNFTDLSALTLVDNAENLQTLKKLITVSYDGEASAAATAYGTAWAITKVNYDTVNKKWVENANGTNVAVKFLKAAPVGTYAVNFSITTKDTGLAFGQYGILKDEDAEFEINATVSINKADAVIAGASYVAPVASSSTYNSPAYVAATDSYVIMSGDYTVTSSEIFADTKYEIGVSASKLHDVSKVGSYELNLALFAKKTSATFTADPVEFTDLEPINYNLTVANGTQHFVSAYDWNVIRDVATSIFEIGNYTTAGALSADQIIRVELARARYDALTDAQKVYFATGLMTGDTTTPVVADQIFLGEFDVATIGTAPSTPTAVTTAKIAYKHLTDAETKAADAAVVKAFDKVVDDSKLSTYITAVDGTGFNVENETHVAAYKTADTYFNALSDADKKIVKTTNSEQYQKYAAAAGKFGLKEVAATKALIAGAVGAYNRALLNAKVIYTSTGAGEVTKFINNAEVKSLTAQAKTAYDALTDAQKTALNVAFDDADKADVSNINKKGGNNVKIDEALAALVKMNAVVGYMEQVINHVNIENYAHLDAKSPVYDGLSAIIYGKDSAAAASYYFVNNGTATTPIVRNDKFAMKDIMDAYDDAPRHLDAVVAEYKATVDFVVKAETYKNDKVAELKDMIAKTFVVGDDYKEMDVNIALAADNPRLEEIVNFMLSETATKGISCSNGTVPKTFKIYTATVKSLVANAKAESIAEADEALAELFDVEAALEAYMYCYNNNTAITAVSLT